MAITWKKLAYEDDVILESDLTAKGDLISASAVGVLEILGVGTDGQVLKALASEDSGLVWAAKGAPEAHAASHKDGGGDELLLHEFGEPTAAVDFDFQQIQNFAIHNVADTAGRTGLDADAVLGLTVYQADVDSVYVVTDLGA